MKSFKSKLRSQINKPVKEGLKTKIGGLELLDDFYTVFSINMRDMGSPVHSKMLIENVLKEFPGKARIAVVYNVSQPVASCVMSPNMLLYWSMLEYACDNGFNCFDFGRSSPEEGSYKFKQQWGAKPAQLYWHGISFNKLWKTEGKSEKSKFGKAIQCWKKLPVSATKIIGPMIRKYIGL
jgi:lipid II:glycine glycyltransferase (peptidoglycan interpeptide bridge formation enzyme)